MTLNLARCLSRLLHEKVYFTSKNLLLKIQLNPPAVEGPCAPQALCSKPGCCAGLMHHRQLLNTAEKLDTRGKSARETAPAA